MKSFIKSANLKWGLLLVLWLGFLKCDASHSMGADITYKWLGGNTYKITLTFYRDCSGVAAPFTPTIDVSSATCSQNLSVTCNARAGTGHEITPVCSSAVTTCSGGAYTGIQEWIYDGTVTLPQQCRDWKFSYSACCRNAAITTISTPSSNMFYVYATLNNLDVTGNNSPTFSNRPVPFVCIGQQYCYNHGAFDADGDSLVYQMVAPLQSATQPVNYIGSYSATQPLTSNPALSLNTINGEICMTPQALEVTVMAVVVTEYRNGVLIGSVERDMQVTVRNCGNNLPVLTGVNGTGSYTTTFCAGQQTCFTIYGSDPDNQFLLTSWNNAISAATFTAASGTAPVSSFCWSPPISDIGKSFTFTAEIQDNACPYYGSQIFSYTINVVGISVNAGPDVQANCSGTATVTAVPSGGSGSYQYSWNDGSTTQSISVSAGTYIVTASDGGACPAIDTVVVTSSTPTVAAFTMSATSCYSSPVSFTDQSGSGVTGWQWDFGDGSTSTATNPSHQYSSNGTYNVSLIITTSAGCTDTIIHSVVFTPAPVASFSGTGACAGTNICFTNQTTGTVNQWNWNFGDNTSSASQNVCHTYSSAGNYTVTLIAGNTSACADTVSQTIVISKIPSVSISASNVCIGNKSPLTATIGIGDTITAYSWDFGNGSTSISQNPNYSYPSAGTYLVTLIVTNSSGCTATTTTTATIYSLPNISAGADQQICNGLSATLNATSGYTYLWMPGNSTGPSVSVNPNITTNYIVQATDAHGCSNSDTVQVLVHPTPVVSAGVDQSICNGATASFTATGANSYTWYPGNVNSSTISASPSANTAYWVVGTDANGCQASDTVNVIVNTNPIVNLSNSIICNGSSSTLNAGNTGSSYLWNTGETTQTITVNTSGNYSVIVTTINGCSASASSNITIGSPLNMNAANAVVCSGQSAILDAGNSGNLFLWSTGATSQTITTIASGNYTVTVTNGSGCSTTFTDTVTVNPTPSVNFSTNTVCFGDTSLFNNLSTVSSGTVTYSWSLGDGSSSTSTSPLHSYGSAGNYTVTLLATSGNGCSATATATATVNPMPVATFTAQDVCQNLPVSFVNNSSISGGVIASTSWNFGDSTSSSISQPNHSYAAWGTYPVTLNVVSDHGCPASYSQNINIFPLPSVAFIDSDACLGNSTQFINQSTIANGSTLSNMWNFGNGDTSSLSNPSYMYATTGANLVTLTVTSSDGCQSAFSQPANVYKRPTAIMVTQNDCYGKPAKVKDQSTSTDGSITQWTWEFGDGTIAYSSAPVHYYNSSGNYNLRLAVTTSHGCADQTLGGLDVFPVPAPQVTANSACQNSAIHIADISPADTGAGLTYNWSLGDGNNSGSKILNHTYAQPGIYNLLVTVTNQYGCVAADSNSVEAYPMPATKFASTDGCFSSPNTFQNQTVIASGNITNYNWNFGDGATSSIANPTHIYSSAGTFNALLVGTSDHGCTTNYLQNVLVKPLPVVVFTGGGEGCTPLPSQFTDSSFLPNYNITAWTWDFGDGSQSFDKNPSHIYNQSGMYPVTLTVLATNGCSATLTMQNTVKAYPSPVADFTIEAVTPDYFNSVIHFDNLSKDFTSYLWNFGDGSSGSNQRDPIHSYADTGKFTVALIVTNSFGCSDSITKVIDAGVKSTLYAPNSFTPNGDGRNDDFRPYYVQMKDIAVSIYDRWGTMIHSWQGLDGSWDGTYKGQLVQEGVYVYQASGLGNDNKHYNWTGSVTVIR